MNQTPQLPRSIDAQTLPDLPQGRLSPSEQIKALRRAQKEADQRVELGMQLYRAAEQHTVHHEVLVAGVKAEQERLKEQLQQDVARSLQTYDQWVGKIDENFTSALKNLEQRIDDLQSQWSQSQQRIDHMMQRSEVFLEQSRVSVGSITDASSKSHTTSATAAHSPGSESESQS